MKERVSILMPVKNAGNYLNECIDSILAQDDENWELLAVDDQSEDGSYELLQARAKTDERIHLFRNEGEGIIAALRTAFSKARGEMIHRMDADDLMAKNKISCLTSLLRKVGKGNVATAKVKYFAGGGVSDGYLKYEDWINEMVDRDNHWEQIYQECVIASPCWMIYKDDLIQCGAFEHNRYPEDYDLVFRFYEAHLKVVSSQKVLHYWRDHSARTSRNHEHYQANSFFALKLHYFFKLDRQAQRPLLIWGAGPKGKILAKMLQERNEEFQWISNNPNKHGKEIYGQLMESIQKILDIHQPQIIITVAQRGAKKEIVDFLHHNGLKEKEDFWFFR